MAKTKSVKNYDQLDKFYKEQVKTMLEGMLDLVKANKIPQNSVLSLADLIDNWKDTRNEINVRRK